MLCNSEFLGIIFKLLQEPYTNTILQLLGQDIVAKSQTLLKPAIKCIKLIIHQFSFIRAVPQTSCRPCVTAILMAQCSGISLEPLL